MAVVTIFLTAVTVCIRALNAQAVSAFSEGMRIVVDAGHGGIDGGVSGKNTGVKESDLNLSISMALKEELEDMGFEVTLTRKTEAGLYDTTAKGFKKRDMQRRKEIIEEVKPALVISIHQLPYPSGAGRAGILLEKDCGEQTTCGVRAGKTQRSILGTASQGSQNHGGGVLYARMLSLPVRHCGVRFFV